MLENRIALVLWKSCKIPVKRKKRFLFEKKCAILEKTERLMEEPHRSFLLRM